MTPCVSVVIPVKENDPSPQLPELLEQLKRQTVECEILLMGGRGIGQARRRGVEQAKCDIIAFIDSDCLLSCDNWIEGMIQPFTDGEVVCTHTIGYFNRNDPAIMRYSILTFDEELLTADSFRPGTGHTLMRKSAILDAGNFKDVNACEDLLLTKVMKGKFVYMPHLKVHHFHATTIKQYLWKQYRTTKGCRDAAKVYDPHFLYNDNEAKEFRNKQIRRNNRMFVRALFMQEDPAWLLWPFMGLCQLFIYRVILRG